MPQPLHPRKLLLVDDSPAVRRIVLRVVRESGHDVEVLEAGDADAAVALAETHGDVDVVLADVRMPGEDGYDLTRRLRALPGRSELPVLLLASRTDEPTAELLRAIGASGCLVKPFTPAALDAALDACAA